MKWVITPEEDIPVTESKRVRQLKRAYRLKPSQKIEHLLKREYIKELNERMRS